MALKGQLLERMVILPTDGGLCLDGIYLRGDGPGLLVASPLPGEGGSMVNPLCGELAYAAAFAGAASLRVDYRGVGASEGERSDDPSRAALDLQEGVSFLVESTGAEGVVVAGVYSGGWAALALAKSDPRVELVLLVKHLLYEKKFTIDGARQKLLDMRQRGEMTEGKKGVVDHEFLGSLKPSSNATPMAISV